MRKYKAGFITGILLTTAFLAAFTNIPLTTHALEATTSPVNYFTSPEHEGQQVKISEQKVSTLNTVNERSLGLNPPADERLYCMTFNQQTDREITQIELVDDIVESGTYSVSGRCYQMDDGFPNALLHTHPRYSDELSEVDKQVGQSVDLTCIQYDTITESPSGQVLGLNCWEIEHNGIDEDAEFFERTISIE